MKERCLMFPVILRGRVLSEDQDKAIVVCHKRMSRSLGNLLTIYSLYCTIRDRCKSNTCVAPYKPEIPTMVLGIFSRTLK
jgi:hypothetical protein